VRRLPITIFLIYTFFTSYSQLVLVPVTKEFNSKSTTNSRTKSTDPVLLPFWDDFSTVRNGYADSKLWQFGNSVYVNEGMGINPPSINVATFDGLDSIGRPYNINDILAKGIADKMISAPIRTDLVTGSDRTRVFLSFFYQYYGNGEAPDLGDYIQLLFKNNNGAWEVMWTKENDGTLQKDTFEQIIIPITADRFFHDNFQFQIRNFARLSGPYDTWHLDYFYVSNGKQQSSPVRPLFPDRTITSKITSPFSLYTAMPVKHFFALPIVNAVKSSVVINNLRQDQISGNGQPISYTSAAQISVNKKNEPPVITNVPLDINFNIGSALNYDEKRVVEFNTMPNLAGLDNTADSIHIKLGIAFDTGDNKIKTPTEGDYDFNVFNPIEFRNNDSIATSYYLSNYYSYDDGTAEYGAGLNQPGAQLAYEFAMRTPDTDTIVAVDIYFPRFGDDTNQLIDFQIRSNLSDSPADILFQQTIPVQRNSQNKFWRISLASQPVIIRNKFYVGWRQNSSAIIAVGLDKNTDSGNKIYANINGTWEQNLIIKGSLMIRPIFGRGNGSGEEITGTRESNIEHLLFPNPSSGTFYLSKEVQEIQLIDATGRKVEFTTQMESELTKVIYQSETTGLHIVRYFHGNRWITQKIIIRK
jgi:hypothetical protein